ncbi:hypothetical protein AKJ63_00575 [candidate division MSBL1 archaeon SCGC-AAA259D18]|uniref:Uncharacterized protein n=1 Tax=candidate division MSBL1 archaeon SCGC-AAA259D18 TaxID=1698262 RepID=A0A133UCE3_9EURY|nr:hypothetical protein AKJ63_00575 [candidate division MSBL1 archaeon SCGC-AAA259D18]
MKSLEEKLYPIAREVIRFVLAVIVSIVMIGVGIVGVERIIDYDLTANLGPTGSGIAVAGVAIAVGLIMGKTIAALKE